MKKIITLLIITNLCISCSSSEDSISNSNGFLPKKATWNDGSVFNYVYQGNKIDKILCNDGTYTDYTYSGDLIVKIEFIDPSTNYIEKHEFEYNNSLLSHVREYENNILITKHDLINTNNNIRLRTTTRFIGTQSITTNNKEYFTNNIQTKLEVLNTNGTIKQTYLFTYDNQNYIYKNIIGYNQISNWYEWGGPINNIQKVIFTDSNSTETTDYIYQYNSNGYPIKTSYNVIGFGIQTIDYLY
jgi:hypothetical protein